MRKSSGLYHSLNLTTVLSGSGLVSDQVSQTLHHLLAKRPEFERGEWTAAIKAALEEEDSILLERFKLESIEPALSGSTVAVCCINLTVGELLVSNLGDSHVILAERDPKTEYPYHIVRTVSDNEGDSKRANRYSSGVSQRLTSPRCPAKRLVSKKQAGQSLTGVERHVLVCLAPVQITTLTRG